MLLTRAAWCETTTGATPSDIRWHVRPGRIQHLVPIESPRTQRLLKRPTAKPAPGIEPAPRSGRTNRLRPTSHSWPQRGASVPSPRLWPRCSSRRCASRVACRGPSEAVRLARQAMRLSSGTDGHAAASSQITLGIALIYAGEYFQGVAGRGRCGLRLGRRPATTRLFWPRPAAPGALRVCEGASWPGGSKKLVPPARSARCRTRL